LQLAYLAKANNLDSNEEPVQNASKTKLPSEDLKKIEIFNK
jgi:hypothetical protein